MKNILITPAADAQLQDLPRPIKLRMAAVIVELAKWPAVSNVKPLTGKLKGWYRKRVGDYRVRFFLRGQDDLVIDKIGKRGEFYD